MGLRAAREDRTGDDENQSITEYGVGSRAAESFTISVISYSFTLMTDDSTGVYGVLVREYLSMPPGGIDVAPDRGGARSIFVFPGIPGKWHLYRC